MVGTPAVLTLAIPEHHWYLGVPEILALGFGGSRVLNYAYGLTYGRKLARVLPTAADPGLRIFFENLDELREMTPTAAKQNESAMTALQEFLSVWVEIPSACELALHSGPSPLATMANGNTLQPHRNSAAAAGEAEALEQEALAQAEQEALRMGQNNRPQLGEPK